LQFSKSGIFFDDYLTIYRGKEIVGHLQLSNGPTLYYFAQAGYYEVRSLNATLTILCEGLEEVLDFFNILALNLED